MITYTWKILELECAPVENELNNVVKVIHWRLDAVDESGVSASINNSYPLPKPIPEQFTDYSSLTEETVIGWLENNLDVGYLRSILANEIASQYNPPVTPLPLPWVKVEEPVLEVIEEPVSVEEPTLEEMLANGYNPNARDGDGDGMVQDGTNWERPIDSQL